MATFLTVVGNAKTPVSVSYEMDDGNIYGLEVMDGEVDVQQYLERTTIDDLEMQCYEDDRMLAKIEADNAEYDRGEYLYQERMAA